MMPHIGDVIRQTRFEKGINRKDLAKKVYVTINYLNALECGKRSIQFDKIARVAHALNIDIRRLLEFYMHRGKSAFIKWTKYPMDKRRTNIVIIIQLLKRKHWLN